MNNMNKLADLLAFALLLVSAGSCYVGGFALLDSRSTTPEQSSLLYLILGVGLLIAGILLLRKKPS